MREPEVMVVRRRRWLVWRDGVSMLLAIAVFLLVRQVGDLQTQLSASSALRTKQLAALTEQLDDLQTQLGVKDARIKQLTDQLVAAGLRPAPAPSPTSVRASGAVRPTPLPGPSPTPVPPRSRPTPAPAPSPAPSPSASPSASPTGEPSCVVTVLGRCLLPG